ncbi:nicotinamidase-related amidase [Paenibacillus baekrokdamisoli]|nr:isochorismatase family protein [Paenibacillus baekrokdamisoli]MBB3072440.1 nicotinamidase-related amidase [Paenibacillus baekrokdamisoli]
METNGTLMVIEIQVGMFLESDPVYKADQLLRNIGLLIERARCSATPIVYVQQNARPGNPLEYGSAGWESNPLIRPEVGEIVIQKATPDSFYETNLEQEGDNSSSKRLFLSGLSLWMTFSQKLLFLMTNNS